MWLLENNQRVGRGENPRFRKNGEKLEITFSSGGNVYAATVISPTLHRFVSVGDEAAFATDGRLIVRSYDTISIQNKEE